MQIADTRKGAERQEVDGSSQGSRHGCKETSGLSGAALLQADKGSEIQSGPFPGDRGCSHSHVASLSLSWPAVPAEGWTGRCNTQIDTPSLLISRKLGLGGCTRHPLGRRTRCCSTVHMRKPCPAQLGAATLSPALEVPSSGPPERFLR